MVFSLVVLPGCKLFDSFRKGSDSTRKAGVPQEVAQASGAVLCTINGKPVLQESDFVKSITQMLQANPYFRGAGIDSLPLSIKKKFFDELVKQKLIIENAQETNLYASEEFQKAYNEMMQLVKDSLTVQFFEKNVFDHINVDDNEVESHFNKNKQQFVKVPGGVLVSGAKFDTEDQANRFLVKTKTHPADFEKLAKADANAKFKEFGRITKDAKDFAAAAVPAPIKESVFALAKFPAVEKVKAGKEFWVVVASDKQDPVYFELDEIKPQIAGMIKNNKFREQLDKQLKDLQGKMTIVVNEDYFKENEAPQLGEEGSDDMMVANKTATPESAPAAPAPAAAA